MHPHLVARIAVLGMLALPAAAFAANFWPAFPSPSNPFGWQVVNTPTAMEAVADGSGGYFVAWDDGYGGHVQHVLANGSTAWPWYVYEPPGSTAGYMNPAIALDGFGGVLLAYETHGGGDELRLQRVAADGSPAPGWPAAGVPVSPSSDYDYLADVAADGEGGAFVCFIRSGPYQVYVQHVLSTGVLDPNWPADGVHVQKDGSTYAPPRVFSDGEGGAMVFYVGTPYGGHALLVSRVDRNGNTRTDLFPGSGLVIANGPAYEHFAAVRTLDGLYGVVWADGRTGSIEVYIDVLDASGRTGAAPPGGLALSSNPATNDQWPRLATNEYRDFLVAWVADNAIMGARRQQDLSLHPEFPAGSAVVSNASGVSTFHLSVDSGGGGDMVVGWNDPSEGGVLRAQRLTRSGAVAFGWAAAGESLATSASGLGYYPTVLGDGDGGVIGVFSDYNMLATNRLRRDGNHGLLRPAILTLLSDVANDQGGRLSLYWRASEIDTVPANPVGSYMVWRRMPAIAAQSRLAAGARAIAEGEAPEAAGPGAIRILSGGSVAAYWEYLGSTPARGWPGYGMTVSTDSDLIAPGWGIPWEVFLVETISSSGAVLGTSAPDSGFTVDNLSPAQPSAFIAMRDGGVTRLSWLPNDEPDFRDYRLHRGTSPSFVPSDANLVAAPTGTTYDDAAAPVFFYKLAATDVHGNSSGFALVTPAQILDAPAAAPAELSFAPVTPNPARERGNLSFALPAAAIVRLAVYDVQGRLVHTLVDGALPAGRHVLAWDLRGGDGRTLSPGVYLARLVTPAGTRVRRLAIVE
jgi:hypothetical protein